MRIAREHRRLETNMNVPPVDENLYVQTLRNRNIPYNVRNRQYDNQHSRGQKPNIPPRQSSLQRNHNVITTEISTQLQQSRNMSIGKTFRQEYTLTPTPRHDRYIRLDKLRSSSLQTHQYNQDRRDINITVQPQSSSLARSTLNYTKMKKNAKRMKTLKYM